MKKRKKALWVIGSIVLALLILFVCGLVFKQYVVPYYEQRDFEKLQRIIEHGSSKELARFFASAPKRNYQRFIAVHNPVWEPFYYVIKQNDMAKLKILIENGLPCFTFGGYIDHPVTFPALIRNPQMIEFLLKSGDAIKEEGTNPLFWAIMNLMPGKQKYAKYDNMVPKVNPRWDEYLRLKQTDDEKVLESINLFIKYNAGINNRESGWRDTPLMGACDKGRLDVIQLLLSAGADPSVEYKNETAVDFCKRSNNFINESEKEKAIDLLSEAIAKRKSEKPESAAASE